MSDQNQQGKLFISGGGNSDDTQLLDFEFVKSLPTGRLLYIPIGLQKNYIGYEECYEWITKTLTCHSRIVAKNLNIDMWVNIKKKRFSEIENFDAIYIGGAQNSYSLMKEFRDTGFIDLLNTFLNSGKNIYGGSTGAIILGKDISVLDESPPNDYHNPNGLKLLENYSIFCHYKTVPMEKLRKFLTTGKKPVVALPEKSGLIVQKDTAQLVGSEDAAIFKTGDIDHPQPIRPNEYFLLN